MKEYSGMIFQLNVPALGHRAPQVRLNTHNMQNRENSMFQPQPDNGSLEDRGNTKSKNESALQ